MSITPVSTSSTITSILPKLSDADQKKFDTIKANLQSALDTLKSGSKSSNVNAQANAQRKAMAQQRIAQIKQAIKSLRQFQGLDAKATARMVAQLAKQLAQAVKDYQAAGGTDASVSAGASSVPSPQGSASPAGADASAGNAPPGSVPAGNTAPVPATPQGNAANAYAQTQQITVKTSSPSDDQDKQFMNDVTQIKNDLRNFVKQLRSSLKKNFMPENLDPDMRDVKDAEYALNEVDRAMTGIGK